MFINIFRNNNKVIIINYYYIIINIIIMFDSNVLYSIFVKHPEEQNMTYFEHLKHAFSYALKQLDVHSCLLFMGLYHVYSKKPVPLW